MTRRALPVLLVPLLLGGFAGCLGGDGGDGPTVAEGDAAAPQRGGPGAATAAPSGDDVTTVTEKKGKAVVERLASASAPTLAKGRAWNVTLTEGAATTTFNLVVVDDASDLVLATDTRSLTYRDALREDLWFLGSFRKDDLAPLRAGVAAPWVQWPLEDGKSWTAPDAAGESVTWRVAYDPAVELGGRTVQGFAVAGASANGSLLYEYSYAPEAKWFTRFVALDPSVEGAVTARYTLTVNEASEAYEGDVIRVASQVLYRQRFSSPADSGKNDAVTVPGGLTRLFVYMDLRSGDAWSGVQGYSNATLLGPDRAPRMWHFRLMVTPYAWDNGGGAACGREEVRGALPLCQYPSGNPFRPYHRNFTRVFDAPAAGAWTVTYVHGGTGELRSSIGLVGLTETVGKP